MVADAGHAILCHAEQQIAASTPPGLVNECHVLLGSCLDVLRAEVNRAALKIQMSEPRPAFEIASIGVSKMMLDLYQVSGCRIELAPTMYAARRLVCHWLARMEADGFAKVSAEILERATSETMTILPEIFGIKHDKVASYCDTFPADKALPQ